MHLSEVVSEPLYENKSSPHLALKNKAWFACDKLSNDDSPFRHLNLNGVMNPFEKLKVKRTFCPEKKRAICTYTKFLLHIQVVLGLLLTNAVQYSI